MSLVTQNRKQNGQFAKGHKIGIGNKHNWKGGRVIDSQGYVRIYKPDHPRAMVSKYVFEHRLVMERNLGRMLDSKEVVHHLDGNKKNNDIENLILLDFGGHQKKHRLGSRNPEHSRRMKKAWREGRFTKVASFRGLRHSNKSKRKMSRARKEWWSEKKNAQSY